MFLTEYCKITENVCINNEILYDTNNKIITE